MNKAVRKWIWILLVGAAVFVPLAFFIADNTPMSVVAFVLAIAALFIWGVFSSWLFGLGRHAIAHMKKPIEKLTFVSKPVGSSRLADYTRSLEHLCEADSSSRRFGVQRYLLLGTLKNANLSIEPIEWETIEATDGELVNVPSNPVYLLRYNDRPFLAKASQLQETYGYHDEESLSSGVTGALELFAKSLDDANEITQWLNTQASAHSIYRGKMLLVASPNDGRVGQTVRIQSRPEQSRDAIVLPKKIVAIAERLVLSNSKHRQQLSAIGHSANLGLLLHGPPGTGKTLLTRYLIDCCQEHTVIVPTDMSVETLRECFRLANYLQPAILVLEDVDLLAQDRNASFKVDGLQELMNQMDGLAPSSDVTVMMSTNRPEVLEPALATRPGRVSQTIEFPLPDANDREKLLKLFFAEVNIQDIELESWVQRTDGASPAFLKELCRRSILVCAQRSDVTEDETPSWKLNKDDIDQAIHDLVVMGGDLTSRSLGFPSESKNQSGFH